MRIVLVLLLLLLSATSFASNAPTVLVFGDSLSAGYGIEVDQSWTSLLQERLESQGYEHRVVNASITGETTEGGVARIDDALARFEPSVVILELGGNDGLRGFPPERMRDNLGKIIATSKATGATVVLLGIRIPLNYGPRYSEAFERAFRDVATEQDVPWIEFFMKGVALNEALMQEDGIHPTAEAQELLLDNAWPIILETLDHTDKMSQQNETQ